MAVFKTLKMAAISGLFAVTAVSVTYHMAHSKTLFELFFRKQTHQKIQDSSQPVKIRKISAPRYYSYKPIALKKVNFSPLVRLSSDAKSENSHDRVKITLIAAVGSENENHDFLDAASTLRSFNISVREDIGQAVVNYYLANPEFLWVRNGFISFQGMQVMQTLLEADRVGMDSREYNVTPPGQHASAEELVRFEMEMSLMAVRYALDARNGRINPNRLSGYHDFPEVDRYKAMQAMEEIASATSPASYLLNLNPDNKIFTQLKLELAKSKKEMASVVTINERTFIRPGWNHEELPKVIAAIRKKGSIKLLQHHGEALTVYSRTTKFTDDLAELVKGFQRENNLIPDGIVGRKTISRLMDGDPAMKIRRLRLSMERLRWHPRDLGARYVFINQPAYQAQYMENGEEKLSMKVIIGKNSNQTYFFHDMIKTVEYNPYWGVPQSIIFNEMLPRLRKNPGYLDALNYEVTTLDGQRVSSASINWLRVGDGKFPYNIRQLPGKRNALGRLKIMFPNRHAIYMHDTPSTHLFKKDYRALSHGCVRLENPRGMAAAVLRKSHLHVNKKIDMGHHNSESVKSEIPVYLSYFTAWPDSGGKIRYFSDVYGRDRNLSKAITKLSALRGSSI